MSVNKNALAAAIRARGNYSTIPNEVWTLPISSKAKIVYLYIITQSEVWNPGTREIAAGASIGRDAVRKALAELQDANMLQIEQSPNGLRNVYTTPGFEDWNVRPVGSGSGDRSDLGPVPVGSGSTSKKNPIKKNQENTVSSLKKLNTSRGGTHGNPDTPTAQPPKPEGDDFRTAKAMAVSDERVMVEELLRLKDDYSIVNDREIGFLEGFKTHLSYGKVLSPKQRKILEALYLKSENIRLAIITNEAQDYFLQFCKDHTGLSDDELTRRYSESFGKTKLEIALAAEKLENYRYIAALETRSQTH